jgi:ADP-ribosylglycohydrolase
VPEASLAARFEGCLVGGAIGDALGAPVEGLTPAGILRWFGGPVGDFVPPAQPRTDGRHKGDGLATDDTLMTVALCRAYLARDGQLTAHDMATDLLPLLADEETWVPEHDRAMPLIQRVHYPEKHMYLRLRLVETSPREGGLGNMVNCGAAMYAAPVGLMNAGDPEDAYRRALDVFSAHQHSFGLEAAAVMAGAVARACTPGAGPQDVIRTALDLARDGTRDAIEAVVAAARSQTLDDPERCQRALRAAVQPFDARGGDFDTYRRTGAFPSQRHSIEELPIALGYVALGGGDFARTVLGAVNYGRDADSTAGMAGSLLGALGGVTSLPARWREPIGALNHLDLRDLASRLLALFWKDHGQRRDRFRRRCQAIDALTGDGGQPGGRSSHPPDPGGRSTR